MQQYALIQFKVSKQVRTDLAAITVGDAPPDKS